MKRYASAWAVLALFAATALSRAQAQANLQVVGANNSASNVGFYTTNSDGTLNTPTTLGVGSGPFGVAVRGDQAFAYVTNNLANNVSVIDLNAGTVVQTIAVGAGPRGVAVSPDGTQVWVCNNTSSANSVSIFSASSSTGQLTLSATLATGASTQPRSVAFSTDGATAYVVLQNSSQLKVYKTSDDSLTATISVGSQPTYVAVNPASARAYVVNNSGNTVSVINTSNNTVAATKATGSGPIAVAVAPDGAHYYIANRNGGSGTLSQFDASTDTTVASDLSIGTNSVPTGAAVSPNGSFLYISDNNLNQIDVFSIASSTGVLTAGGSTASGSGPGLIAMATNGNAMLASGITFLADTADELNTTGSSANFTGGTLSVGGAGLTFSNAVSLGSGGGTINTNGNTVTLSGVVSGSGALTVSGAGGDLILAANETYTGTTAVNSGNLTINGTTTGGTITVANGSIINGSGTINGDLVLVSGSAMQGTLTVTGKIFTVPAITSLNNATAFVGVPFSYQVTASGNPTSYAVTAGVLPPGLTLDATLGKITGTATTAQSVTPIDITATNAAGSGFFTLQLTVSNPVPGLSSAATAGGTVGRAFSYQVTGSNSPTGFAATGLPAGLAINATTGVISGTPTGAAGSYSVALTLTNASGSGTATLGLTVDGGASSYTPYAFVTYAGQVTPGSTDATGKAAKFLNPDGVAVDGSGNAYVADTGNDTIRKIAPGGVVTTLAGTAATAGSADGTGSAARFKLPDAVASDATGNLYVADTGNNTVRKIAAGGVVTTLAGTAGSTGSADGTGSAARFNAPAGVAVDSAGSVYVADTGNHTIRKISSAGAVTTLAGTAGSAGSADGAGAAARFNAPGGVAVDGSGNLYVADTNNNTIRKITSAGVVTTLAGFSSGSGSGDGTGNQALFLEPSGVAVDGNGNVFVTDWGNDTIRWVTSAGVVTTLAGSPGISGSADGAGSSARFNAPYGIAVDAGGNLYVADSLSGAIRLGAASGAKPGIVVQPQGASVAPGGLLSLSVVAQSTSAMTYQWFLNGTVLAGQTSPALGIGNMQAANAGSYTVGVTNSAGTTTSSAAAVTVAASAAPAAAGSSGGGGGAPSLWFLAALAVLAAVRRRARGLGARA